jgi:anti-sigma regulatory factor (Ser/Thr protein kinase)
MPGGTAERAAPVTVDLRTTAPDVTLRFPAEPEYVGVARLTAASVAVRAGLSIDEVDDVRIAVDEMCFILIEGADAGGIVLRFDLQPDVFSVTCTYEGPLTGRARGPADVPALARQILASVVDHFEAHLGPDHRTLTAAKRHRRPVG